MTDEAILRQRCQRLEEMNAQLRDAVDKWQQHSNGLETQIAALRNFSEPVPKQVLDATRQERDRLRTKFAASEREVARWQTLCAHLQAAIMEMGEPGPDTND